MEATTDARGGPVTDESESGIARYFRFRERGTTFGTELRAGLTTFMVMAYILFLNGSILTGGFAATNQADPRWDAATVAAGTALIAGVMTIAMGLVSNYPFALAAGLGINAIVAYSLTGRGLSPAGAMGVIVIEGVVVTLLVLVGLREAIMNAVPVSLKRAIGVGIGLFILFIGFATGGLIKTNAPATLVTVSFPTTAAQWVFIAGLLITIVLFVMRIKAALIISIVVTTILALIFGVTAIPDASKLIATPRFDTLGAFDIGQVFSVLPIVTALLVIFAIMLTDFFDTMGTVTGVAAEAGLARQDGTVPDVGRPLLVDSLAAVAGGLGGVSSNTTYIESAAGVADGGRTGLTAVTTGVLFLIAIFLSPIALIVPSAATAPVLVLVGYLMFTLIKDIPVGDVEDGLPALLTMILMPLTYDITVGIGAGFISWVLIKLVRGKTAEIHWLMWLVAIAFLVFFAQDWITTVLPK
ncbi:MAG TPA: NCS2 family permease [Candidatus Limnocylindria bacterium]|nr:NCS2 family permease [Candidatus Limnocylindria bacterium]